MVLTCITYSSVVDFRCQLTPMEALAPRSDHSPLVPVVWKGMRARTETSIEDGVDYYGTVVDVHDNGKQVEILFDDDGNREVVAVERVTFEQQVPPSQAHAFKRQQTDLGFVAYFTMRRQWRLIRKSLIAVFVFTGLLFLARLLTVDRLGRLSGEIDYYFSLPLCRRGGNFALAVADADVPALPEIACPSQPASRGKPPPAVISLRLDDGFRAGGEYAPTILLESTSFALLRLSVTDASGTRLIEPLTLQLGPEGARLPWAEPMVDVLPPPSPLPTPPQTWLSTPLPPPPPPTTSLPAPPPSPRPPSLLRPGHRRLLKAGHSNMRDYTFRQGVRLANDANRIRISNNDRAPYGSGRWGGASSQPSTRVACVPSVRVPRGTPTSARAAAASRGAFYHGSGAVPKGARIRTVTQRHFYLPLVYPRGGYGGGGGGSYGSSYCDGSRTDYGSRADCGSVDSFEADGSMDRYELAAATLIAPRDARRWPLNLTIEQVDVYDTLGRKVSDAVGSVSGEGGLLGSGAEKSRALLISFNSDDNDALLVALDTARPWLWFGLYIALLLPGALWLLRVSWRHVLAPHCYMSSCVLSGILALYVWLNPHLLFSYEVQTFALVWLAILISAPFTLAMMYLWAYVLAYLMDESHAAAAAIVAGLLSAVPSYIFSDLVASEWMKFVSPWPWVQGGFDTSNIVVASASGPVLSIAFVTLMPAFEIAITSSVSSAVTTALVPTAMAWAGLATEGWYKDAARWLSALVGFVTASGWLLWARCRAYKNRSATEASKML